MRTGNQLSRYGAIAKAMMFTTGRVYFLLNATGTAFSQSTNLFPVDDDGISRVYTTWAALIAQVILETPAPLIVVDPLFVTAPTLAQIAQLDTAQAIVIQAGQNLPDGSYIAAKAAAAFSGSATVGGLNAITTSLFQVNGRVEILYLAGEFTVGQPTAVCSTQFTFIPTINTGITTGLAAAIDILGQPTGSQMTITGTLATAAVLTSTGGAYVRQAAPIIVTAGKIVLQNVATIPGMKFRIHYKPLDPGAFISAL